LDRRSALKLLAAGTAVSAMSPQLFAAFRGVHANLPQTPTLRILNAHQDATVTAAAELLLPPTDTPGARAARVNEFIDHIVADWYSEEDRQRFLDGLSDMDARSQKLFGKDFVALGSEQQADVFQILGDELALALEAVATGPPGYRGEAPEPEGNFYMMFRELTLTGYFTSAIGATQALHEVIIPGHFDGCTPLANSTDPKGS
jgi:hypothetical protein